MWRPAAVDCAASVLAVGGERAVSAAARGCLILPVGLICCARKGVGQPGFYAGLVETLTFLFTDIEGSTALLRRVGQDVYAEVLAEHHVLIRSALAAYDGRELNTLGDGFFAAFASPRLCAAAVLAMQQALEAHAWPAGQRVRVRMGVHTGEGAQTAAAGMLGLDVHRAARIAAVAHGGQILLSEAAAVLVRDGLPDGAVLTDLGAHRLKDLGRPEELFQLSAPGLQASFPPLRSLGNPVLQNNLPVQPAKFVGRGRELAEVRALVEASPLVTLTGAGGCGKTRLSLQVAAELLDGTGDGVWLAELAAVTDEEAVAPVIAAALGVSVQPGRPAADTLLDALVPQDVLIVVDNCEHLIGACAKIADTILRRCPGVHLLATSREPLGIGGEIIYRVPSLSLPGTDDPEPVAAAASEAVALFVDRAAGQGVAIPVDAHTAPLLVSICRRLDGMPLAIELAAARLRSLSLSELSDRLDQRFRLLTGGSRAALERQQTLRATVGWSYSLLSSAEQQLLRRLAVFADSFDLGAAEAVCGLGDIEPLEVTGLLGSLVDKSLVQAEQAGDGLRYRLLETIRQFAAERLLGTGTDEATAVAAAHCQHFLSVAETAQAHLDGPGQPEWLARLDADQANLWRAAEYAAADPAGTARALRFAIALRRYWIARVVDGRAFALLAPVLERPDARADQAQYAAASVAAMAAARAINLPLARQLGDRAVGLARELGDDRLLIEALWLSADFCYFAGDPEIGLPLGTEAVERARRLGDDVLLGASLEAYLLCAGATDPAASRELFAEAVACTERSGDLLTKYVLHNNAGVHALRAGDLPRARDHLEQAAAIMPVISEKSHHVAVNLGWVARQENNLADAVSQFETGLWQSRRTGERSGLAYASLGLACAAADLGDWQRAAELHGVAQAFLDRLTEPWQDLEEAYRRDSIAKVRAALGSDEFDRAYSRGAGLSFDDAFSLAMARPA
jgi:predicted ATPase/class 3 adenylate cyclase